MTKYLLSLSAACLFTCGGLAFELTPKTRIVYPGGETGADRHVGRAAVRLRDAVKEATGHELALVPLEKAGDLRNAIVIGEAGAVRAGLPMDGVGGYTNVVAEKDGSVFLYGKDASGRPAKKSPYWEECRLPSVRAITRFMEDAMGARLLAPGPTGTDIPNTNRVALSAGACSRECPRFCFGNVCNNDMMFAYANEMVGWADFHSYGGHTYPEAVPTSLFKTHPEYFAERKGKRTLGNTPGCTANCISNPEVRKLILEEMLRRYDEGARVCQLGQSDGDATCGCAACKAFHGTGDDWCEKFWLFHRDLALEIERLRPGKVVQIISYGATRLPPKSFRKFPSNVMVEVCDYSVENLERWARYDVPHGFTVYTYLWGDYPQPGLTAKHSFAALADVARRFVKYRVRGVYRCGYGELYGTEGPGYYVFNRLLQDPARPVGPLVTEYCRRMYGPAAETMLRFHYLLDARFAARDKMSEKFVTADGDREGAFTTQRTKSPFDSIVCVYSPELLGELDALLAAAVATPGLTERQKTRLALVRLEYGYARNLAEIAIGYSAFRLNPDATTLAPLADRIDRRNAFIDGLFGPDGRLRPFKGWNEIVPFRTSRANFQHNGRLGATIDEPLTWDTARMREAFDYAGWKARDAANARLVRLTEWSLGERGWEGTIEPSDGGRCVHLAPGEKGQVKARVKAKTPLLFEPGRTYRVSWFVRRRNVQPLPGTWGGSELMVRKGTSGNRFFPIPGYRLPTTGWLRQSVEVVAEGDKPYDPGLCFLLWQASGEMWIEDVSVESL